MVPMPKLRSHPRLQPSRLRRAPETPAPRGTVWFGAYEVLRELEGPGPGKLWLVRHLRRGGLFAARVIPARTVPNAGQRPRIPAAAHRLARVRHAAVERCWEVRSGENGSIVLFLELCEGVLLADRLAEGALSANEVLALGARLAAGLAAAHARGLVHGQISPRSVMLPYGRLERAKLIDFAVDGGAPTGDEAAFAGEPERMLYASPEQLGFFGGEVDARTDHYSLGLMLCEAALGHPLDLGDDFLSNVTARRALTELPSDIPESLRPLIEPLTGFEPDDRPELTTIAALAPTRSPQRRKRWLRWGTSAAGIALLLANSWLRSA